MVRRLFVGLVLLALARAAVAQYDPMAEAKKHFEAAETAYKLGQFKDAIKGYEATHRLSKSPLMLYNIAQAHRRQYDLDGDVANLRAARDRYREFLAAVPKTPLRGKVQGFITEIDQQVDGVARKHYEEGETAYRVGKFAKAIAEYEAAYALVPKPALLYNLGQAHRKQYALDGKVEHLRAAREVFQTYLREVPDSPQKPVLEQIMRALEQQQQDFEKKMRAELAVPEPAKLKEARRSYDSQDYGAALTALTEALQGKGNRREHLVTIFRLLGQTAALTGEEAGATEAFKRWLALDPQGELPADADARTLRALAAAKEFWKGRERLRIEHLPPGRVPPATPLAIPVSVPSDPLKMIHHLEFLFRRAAESRFERQVLARGQGAVSLTAAFLRDSRKPYRVEYYVVALDEHGGTVDSLGSEGMPLAFLVTREARPGRWYTKWWVWAIAGTVAAGAATTGAVLGTRSSGYPATDFPSHQVFRLRGR
ncbi:MAG: tetratricopeptide repeat protein [Deltaproteobacteria bacterium]|nr:tetratricopeptide repeat protein [Deltaproteobacteria bacterium]